MAVNCGTPLSPTSAVSETSIACDPLTPPTPCGVGADATPCAENHTLEIVTTEYGAALRSSNKWTVPACNLDAKIIVPGLRIAHIGSYLWNKDFGNFEVVGFNPSSSTLTVRNFCIPGNASPGAQVPAYSLFVVSPPPFDITSNLVVYLTTNFDIPAVGNTVAVEVTSTTGLQSGYNVAIGLSQFKIDTVIDATHLLLLNEGLGGDIGSTVVARNGANDYQYAIIISNSSSTLFQEKQIGPLTLDGSNTTQMVVLSPGQIISYTNASNAKAAQIYYSIQGRVTGNVQHGANNIIAYNAQLLQKINGGSLLAVSSENVSKLTATDAQYSESKEMTWNGVASVAPGQTFTLDAEFLLSWQGSGTGAFNIDTLTVGVAGIAVIS